MPLRSSLDEGLTSIVHPGTSTWRMCGGEAWSRWYPEAKGAVKRTQFKIEGKKTVFRDSCLPAFRNLPLGVGGSWAEVGGALTTQPPIWLFSGVQDR